MPPGVLVPYCLYSRLFKREYILAFIGKVNSPNKVIQLRIAINLNLGQHLILGKGEENNEGRLKKSNLCNVFEALFGYFSLNIGIEETSNILIELVKNKISYLVNEKAYFDPKSKLQEKLQEENLSLPIYESKQLEDGKFKIDLYINNILYSTALGKRKIDAEKEAAEIALNKF